MIPFFNKISGVHIAGLLFALLLGAVQFLLPFPDSNDFYELSRLCLLMDGNVGYCVNNNWGFAHPLLCWLLTQVTGDLLISQRLLSFGGTLLLGGLSATMLSTGKFKPGKYAFAAIALLLCSPWMLELSMSVHGDSIPIALVLAAVLLLVKASRARTLIAAGFTVGMAYWFRFHFLSFSILFPLLAPLLVAAKVNRYRTVLLTAAGAIVAVGIPHLLCLMVYGVFSISNEKFVLAQALGLVDWTFASAQMLDTLSKADILRSADFQKYLIEYAVNFLKSGLFPVLFASATGLFFAGKMMFRQGAASLVTNGDPAFRFSVLALYGILAVVPFTLLRGFTWRLEAACVGVLVPLLLWCLSTQKRTVKQAVLLILVLGIAAQEYKFIRIFTANRTALFAIDKAVNATIPEAVVKNKPDAVLSCVDYYNPHNRYRCCNPFVFAGWGVRFAPFVKNFGYVDMMQPYDNRIFTGAKYVIVPTHPDYFTVDNKLEAVCQIMFRDETVTILAR